MLKGADEADVENEQEHGGKVVEEEVDELGPQEDADEGGEGAGVGGEDPPAEDGFENGGGPEEEPAGEADEAEEDQGDEPLGVEVEDEFAFLIADGALLGALAEDGILAARRGLRSSASRRYWRESSAVWRLRF